MGYKRVILKISGEVLSGKQQRGFSKSSIRMIADELHIAAGLCELAIVIGGGNLFRGSREGKELSLQRNVADYVGMEATILNGLILCDALEQRGVVTRLMTAHRNEQVAEPYLYKRALRHLEKGRVVVLAGGTGNSSVTTDSAMVIRAIELNTHVALKGTKVDGIFDKDPEKHSDARMIRRISHEEFGKLKLKVLDPAAVSHAGEHNITLRVFNIFEPEGNLARVLLAKEEIGSVISTE